MRILYLMNVEWNWIKQRPHFIAEHLSLSNDVLLFYPYSYHRKGVGFCQNRSDTIKPHKYYHIPLRGHFQFLRKLDDMALKVFFYFIILFSKPDVIWVASPRLGKYIPKKEFSKVIYDCMDDYYAMSKDESVIKDERAICLHSNKIIASSQSLISKISERYGIEKSKITLVRNGYGGEIIEHLTNSYSNELFNIAYIGTVSAWFDFELITKLANEISDIVIHIIGPVDMSVKNECAKLESLGVIFHGSVEHDKLYGTISNMDCLIMPFIVNDIILSVDPVKLYEYINFNKNIIVVKYPEIERFSKFVNFYSSYNEVVSIIEKLRTDRKPIYTEEERIEFLKENGWTSRVQLITETINNI